MHSQSKPILFFTKAEKCPKIHMELEKTLDIILSKMINTGVMTILEIKMHYRAIVIKTVWY